MTIDLFGADQSSNAATFYSSGLKGRYEETQARRRPSLKGQTYKVLEVQRRQARRAEVPMLNALNEVLRDDFIKDSVAGVGRWNKVIEKAGLPHRAGRAAQGVQPPDRRARRRQGVARTAVVVGEAEWASHERDVAADRRRTAPSSRR